MIMEQTGHLVHKPCSFSLAESWSCGTPTQCEQCTINQVLVETCLLSAVPYIAFKHTVLESSAPLSNSLENIIDWQKLWLWMEEILWTELAASLSSVLPHKAI